ncbi:hypothetical protein MiTs_01211 [Microcystis aeruginosa NIES-2521]|uniref:Uncharacterized protein n=1 Tax=Microcystis aeruginosa NIES-2521 TaxID=2303983 RepID=A0A5A5S1E0_MICAE|nr:hypothetical protein MiTs_01211 [Microcystis aeruginosa NIES-2521]
MLGGADFGIRTASQPRSLLPDPTLGLFQQTLNSWAKNQEKQQKSAVTPLTNSQK